MNKKITLAVVLTIIVFGIGLSVVQNTQNSEKYSRVFYLDATFYKDKKYVEIKFDDSTQKTASSVLEIQGMETSFQKTFTGSNFTIQVPFDSVPKYGWKTMPVTLVVVHSEFGKVGVKVDIHDFGEPSGNLIFSEP
ncbi:hypothetical protein [Candidatus Nitrosotenuis sp. DW1]|uniref:hypothetical protein n=1 Tax=Candidatus Nitrosotenuis sp. DW1 TaxID=2259672 RepID=UPI0015CB365B|nr:hypothetical protein [Candidatus Nitrosotenuis sp. DW1]QLH09038.1 hypothetical protein DSQ19_05730 [Candidatus Nitrosotenuis sp. DW1]